MNPLNSAPKIAETSSETQVKHIETPSVISKRKEELEAQIELASNDPGLRPDQRKAILKSLDGDLDKAKNDYNEALAREAAGDLKYMNKINSTAGNLTVEPINGQDARDDKRFNRPRGNGILTNEDVHDSIGAEAFKRGAQ